MEKVLAQAGSVFATISAYAVFLTSVHEIVYFSHLDVSFLRYSSIADIISNSLEWLPLIVFVAISFGISRKFLKYFERYIDRRIFLYACTIGIVVIAPIMVVYDDYALSGFIAYIVNALTPILVLFVIFWRPPIDLDEFTSGVLLSLLFVVFISYTGGVRDFVKDTTESPLVTLVVNDGPVEEKVRILRVFQKGILILDSSSDVEFLTREGVSKVIYPDLLK